MNARDTAIEAMAGAIAATFRRNPQLDFTEPLARAALDAALASGVVVLADEYREVECPHCHGERGFYFLPCRHETEVMHEDCKVCLGSGRLFVKVSPEEPA